MAGDWIKLECTTPDKPEIVRMAAALHIDQDAVVGKLLRLWVWADQNSVNGEGVTITAAFIDRLTNRRGFAAAMRAAGWLTGDDCAMTFPNFERHNGVTGKARSETARRMGKLRGKRHGSAENVTGKTSQKAKLDGEKTETSETPPARETPKVEDVRLCAERFAPTSTVRDKPDAGFVDWWFDEQEKCGWIDPNTGLPWHNWQAAFTAAWRAAVHNRSERDSRRGSRPPPTGKAQPKHDPKDSDKL